MFTKRKLYTIYIAVIATLAHLLLISKPFLVWFKWGKISATVTTMLISIWSYTLLYPWEFASTLVLLIFIHEIGHVLAARYIGLHVTAPTFIPFLGAFVMTKNKEISLERRGFVSIGGPVFGELSGIICFIVGLQLGIDWLASVALLFLLINLVNSFPFYQLDGYWILKVVTYQSPRVQGFLFGLFILLGFGVGIYFKSLTICIIYSLLLIETWLDRKDESETKVFTKKLIVEKSLFLNNGAAVPRKRKKVELQFIPDKNGERETGMLKVLFPKVGMIGRIESGSKSVKRISLIETVQSGDQLVLTLKEEEGAINFSHEKIHQRVKLIYGIAYILLVLSQLIFLYKFWDVI